MRRRPGDGAGMTSDGEAVTRASHTAVTGQGSVGPCALCGLTIEASSAFVNIDPTNWNDPSAPKSKRWVPPDTDIHGWTPFVVTHPECFARDEGADALAALVANAHPDREPHPDD